MTEIYHQPVKADLDPERAKAANRVTWVGAFFNVALTVVKGVAGVMGNSAAMVVDAVHSLSDLATDGVALISTRIASQGADEQHPYGHGRAETIGTALIGGALLAVGVGIAYEVIVKLVAGRVFIPTWPALAAAVVSIVAKEWLYWYTVIVGRRIDAKQVIANAWHHRSDAVSSVAALFGIGGAMAGYPILDPLAAMVVVAMIVKVGWEITAQSMRELMESTAPPETVADIRKTIRATPGVRRFHELRTRTVGADIYVDAHILVEPCISVSEAHNIAETVRENLKEKTSVTDALIHIDAEDDIHYQLVRFDRKAIEADVTREALTMEGVRGVSEFVVHMLQGRILVEFSLDLADDLTVGDAKRRVALLQERLAPLADIHTAVIRARLTPGMLETDFARTSPPATDRESCVARERNMDISPVDLSLAREALAVAREAGEAIMTIYREGDLGVTTKEDRSPLTRADLAAHRIIVEKLPSLGGGWPVLSEESRAIDFEVRRGWRRYWLVDPLDGTKEFINRRDEFTVNIALVENGRPILGVVVAPALGREWLAAEGCGAFTAQGGDTLPIHVRHWNGGRLRIVASKSHVTPELERFLSAIDLPTERISIGSSLKLCLVATGEADLYPRLGPTMEWDTAAAHAIVSEAGGRVESLAGTPLVYNKENLLNPFFMVTGAPPYDWRRHAAFLPDA